MHEFARTSVRRAPAALACATPDGVRAPGSIAAGSRPVVGSPSLFPWAGRPLAVPGGCERTLLSRFLLHQHSKTRRELLQERGLRGCGPGGPAAGGSEGRAAGLAVEGRARGGRGGRRQRPVAAGLASGRGGTVCGRRRRFERVPATNEGHAAGQGCAGKGGGWGRVRRRRGARIWGRREPKRGSSDAWQLGGDPRLRKPGFASLCGGPQKIFSEISLADLAMVRFSCGISLADLTGGISPGVGNGRGGRVITIARRDSAQK